MKLLIVLCLTAALSQPLDSSERHVQSADSAGLFAYDSSVAFDVKELSVRKQDGIVIRDINYAPYVPRHGRVAAYLVRPAGEGTFAGAIFFHWLGRSKSDRTEFLDEAITLAGEGVVSLLIQGYFPWLEKPTNGVADRQQVIDQTIELRRALDLLLSQPGVDQKRIGFVGHDYGAMYGAIAAGVDKRAKAFVFMAGMGSFSDWSLKYWPATASAGEEAYRQAVKEVDPINHVANASPAALLFQFAETDKYVPKSTAAMFFDKASEPKQVKWYDTTHDLDITAARNDRREWLVRQLNLRSATDN